MTRHDQKIEWEGDILAIQPRIRLMRSFDERAHSYQGYLLQLRGMMDGDPAEFAVALGKAAQAKHGLQAGDRCKGRGHPVLDHKMELADVFKVSALQVVSRGQGPDGVGFPMHGVPPPLDVYRSRGHRRLAARTYATKCTTCIWGAEMPVEITVDHWERTNKRFRKETFCYGPKACPIYAAGPTRKVPGRKGMSWEEPDWVDEEATRHRDPDE